MSLAQIVRSDTNEPVNLANADGVAYAAEDEVLKVQSPETQVIDADMAMANNKQLLGINAEGQHKAPLALRTYYDGDDNVIAEQAEFGSSSMHANINSIDRPTVEMQGHSDKEMLAFLSDIQQIAHETKVIDLSTLGIAGISGTLSWIIVHLSQFVSDISVWGEIITDTQVQAGEFNILSLADEPLFDRFVGVVEKVALNIHTDGTLAMLPYRYDEDGMTITIQQTDVMQVTLQDRLFLVAENLSDAESRV